MVLLGGMVWWMKCGLHGLASFHQLHVLGLDDELFGASEMNEVHISDSNTLNNLCRCCWLRS